MVDIIVTLAKSMPLEFLISKLEDDISNFKANPSDSNLNTLEFSCVLIATKSVTKNDNIDATIERLKQHQKISELIKTKL